MVVEISRATKGITNAAVVSKPSLTSYHVAVM
jgi:hypothetical protein